MTIDKAIEREVIVDYIRDVLMETHDIDVNEEDYANAILDEFTRLGWVITRTPADTICIARQELEAMRIRVGCTVTIDKLLER